MAVIHFSCNGLKCLCKLDNYMGLNISNIIENHEKISSDVLLNAYLIQVQISEVNVLAE